MAGIDGLELAQRLRGLDVSTPIVMTTGYPDENIAAKACSAGVRQVLLKPNASETPSIRTVPQASPETSGKSPP